MADYISRNEAINAIKSLESSMPAKDNYAKGYDAALGRVLIAVRGVPPTADVQPVDRWISFKDKQPQEGGFYLTYYAEHIRVSQWFPSKNWYNEHGGNVTNMVEYWQPLPEPPKQ